METRKFKTTAKCQGCVSRIKPYLDKILPENTWAFDLTGPVKILTVTADCPEEIILKAVQDAGFKAEPLK